ncbi:MAG: response regulator [Stellaceae bacterium]
MAAILVIDDDPQMRRLFVRILTGAGHTAHVADNGKQGIELFRSVSPALVITDIVMPDMEGIELIRELRREAPTVPILAVSGSGRAVYLRAATAMGAAEVLAKPFRNDELLSLVEGLLETAK